MGHGRGLKLLVIATAFSVMILMYYQMLNPRPGFFLYQYLANVITERSSGDISIDLSTSVPFQKPFILILSDVFGIPIEKTMELPLGLVGRGILYAGLTYAVSHRYDLTAIFGFIMVISPWSSWGYNSIWVHSIGSFMFLAFVLATLKLSERPSDVRANGILLLFGLALIGWDYTTTVWAILFIGYLSVVHPTEELRPRLLNIGILIGIVYFLKRIPYTYVEKTASHLFFPDSPLHMESPYELTQSTDLLTFSKFFYGVAGIFCIIYFYYKAKEVVKENKIRMTVVESVLVALGVGGVSAMALYLLMGRFTETFIYLLSPFLALVAVVSIRNLSILEGSVEYSNKLATGLAVLLVFAVIGGFTVHYQNDSLHSFSESRTGESGEWLGSYNQSAIVLTDLISAGRLQIPQAKTGSDFTIYFYDDETYRQVVENEPTRATYIIADYQAEETWTLFWYKYEPVSWHRDSLDGSVYRHSVYTTGGATVYYETRKREEQ